MFVSVCKGTTENLNTSNKIPIDLGNSPIMM